MENNDLIQSPPGDAAADPTTTGCGCMPASAPGVDAGSEHTDTNPGPVTASASGPEGIDAAHPVLPRHPFKLVITARPQDNGGLGVVLAIGADGCDPLFRAIDVESVEVAVAALPGLVADAETRWASQPRNPTRQPSPRVKAPGPRDTSPAPPSEGATTQAPVEAATPAPMEPAPKPADTQPGGSHRSSDQLALFG